MFCLFVGNRGISLQAKAISAKAWAATAGPARNNRQFVSDWTTLQACSGHAKRTSSCRERADNVRVTCG